MKRVFTDRSRTETYQRCKRARFLEYHQDGKGIVSNHKPLPLAVGGTVHAGLAVVLQKMTDPKAVEDFMAGIAIGTLEDDAVKAALVDFEQFAGKLSLDLSESQAFEGDIKTLEAQLLQTLGTTIDEQVEQLAKMRERSINEFDKYLYEEQKALVEGMVRAWVRRRLRPLLEEFEVLEVEREGEWQLSAWREFQTKLRTGDEFVDWELWFMSRPDAILLERQSKQLYIQSFKTGASWDIRKAKDAERDMQGLSEGVEVEKRLGEWWQQINNPDSFKSALGFNIPTPTYTYLKSLSAPPRILGIRYEYLLKGERRLDKDLTAELGLEVRSQSSPLVRGYLNPGMTSADSQWNVSWDYIKEGGEMSKLYWKSWRGAPVWKHMTVKEWIDLLCDSTETIGEEGRSLGWSSKAQATGFLKQHPLDSVFVPPIICYRNDDDLRDWLEQTEAQEVRVAEDVERVAQAKDEGERRHLLNVHFTQTRKACEYPSTCQFVKVCFGGAEIRRDPLGSGLYQLRKANHPQEEQP